MHLPETGHNRESFPVYIIGVTCLILEKFLTAQNGFYSNASLVLSWYYLIRLFYFCNLYLTCYNSTKLLTALNMN